MVFDAAQTFFFFLLGASARREDRPRFEYSQNMRSPTRRREHEQTAVYISVFGVSIVREREDTEDGTGHVSLGTFLWAGFQKEA